MIKSTLRVGLLMSTLALASCNDATGGGWLVSATDPNKKAHFGFSFHCKDQDGMAVVSGRVEYKDQGYTVKDQNGKLQKLALHGNMDAKFSITCADVEASFGETGSYSGTYSPQPKTLGEGGTFRLTVQDLGQKGRSKEDTFSLILTGGVYDGYSHDGVIQGGQIKVGKN